MPTVVLRTDDFWPADTQVRRGRAQNDVAGGEEGQGPSPEIGPRAHGSRGCGAASDMQVLLPLAPPATDGGVLEGRSSGDAPAQIADRIRSHQYCSWYFSFIENTSNRVTRRVQARVPRKHATYRRYRTARTDTGLRCGAWRGVATNDHTQRVSLYLPRPTAGLRHVCMCIQGVLVRRRAGGKHTSKAASCSAHCPGRRGPAFKMPFAQMQAARSSAKKLATEIAGAKALERARRGGAAARRGRRRADDMASRLRPGRGRTGWKAGPREGPGRKGV